LTDWQRFVRLNGPAVYGTAWRILGHAADAEDVVQDVFLEAYVLHRKQEVRRWPVLLRRMAACRALDRLRRRPPVEPIAGGELAMPGGGPEAEAEGRELADRLLKALPLLPPRAAEVFCLRYFEQLSSEEIAAALAISPSAVSTALHKARTQLQALLAEPQRRGEAS
jgi:RNA polymerase sigma-70 factor (ECF subfamily)